MHWKILLAALAFAAIVLGSLPRNSSGAPEGYTVVMTAYTCEAHPNNPMYPCGPLRWGGNIYARGIACLEEWRGWHVEVPGFGTYRCDDTIGRPYYNGTPRVDLRVPTLAEALHIGRRYVTVYHVDGVQPVAQSSSPTLPPPSPTVTPSPPPTSPPPPPPTSPPPASPTSPPPPSPTSPPPPTPTPPPPPPTATATPQPLAWTYKDGMSNLIYGLVPQWRYANRYDPSTTYRNGTNLFPARSLSRNPILPKSTLMASHRLDTPNRYPARRTSQTKWRC